MDETSMLTEGQRYWLAHSEGFRVDSDGGRVGVVEGVIEPAPGEAPVLIVRAGLLGSRLLVVSAEEIASVVPRRMRLVLRPSAVVGTGDFVHELIGRVRRGGQAEHPRAA
jgi:hypothetical protein